MPDRSMQLNEAKFLQNGKCGYVLKPNHLRQFSRDYNPPSVYSPADEDLVSFVVMVWDSFMPIVCNYIFKKLFECCR